MRRPTRLRLVSKEDAGKRSTDIFDDLDNLRAAAEALPDQLPKYPPRKQPARDVETFAQIPHERGIELYRHREHRIGDAGWTIVLELDRQIVRDRRHINPLELNSERLKEIGVVESVRAKALRRLEAAGIIKVEPRSRGLAPLVTLVWRPLSD
jgi:hypothetical protein